MRGVNNNQSKAHLLNLPQELKDQIFSDVLDAPYKYDKMPNSSDIRTVDARDNSRAIVGAFALSLTCREMYPYLPKVREAVSLLGGETVAQARHTLARHAINSGASIDEALNISCGQFGPLKANTKNLKFLEALFKENHKYEKQLRNLVIDKMIKTKNRTSNNSVKGGSILSKDILRLKKIQKAELIPECDDRMITKTLYNFPFYLGEGADFSLIIPKSFDLQKKITFQEEKTDEERTYKLK